MERFITVARVSEVKSGSPKFIRIGGIDLALHNSGGAFYATQDCCTGDGGSLSEGKIVGSMIECPSDKIAFYLPTGECIDLPVLRRLHTFPVRIDGDEAKVDLEKVLRIAAVTNRAFELDQLWVS